MSSSVSLASEKESWEGEDKDASDLHSSSFAMDVYALFAFVV